MSMSDRIENTIQITEKWVPTKFLVKVLLANRIGEFYLALPERSAK
jgi:hypothetical protein